MPPFVLALLKFLPAAFSAASSIFSGLTQFKMNRRLMQSEDWWNSQTGEGLTTAQQQTNEFNAVEAEKNRVWQTEMSNTEYQRGVVDMKAAGVNPALAMSNGGASTPSGSPASSGSVQPTASMSDLMQIALLPMQMKMMNQQVKAEQLENERRAIDLQFLGAEKTTALALTSSQIRSVESALQNNEVQRALWKSDISLNAAREALTVQDAIATSIDNETRGALNNAMLNYRAAETAYTEQKTAESKKQMDVMEAQVNELYQRAILEGAQSGLYDQQTRNLLVEHGILEYNEKMKAYEVNKQNADRNWRIAGQVVDMVTGVVGSAGSLMIGGSMLGNTLSRSRVLRGTLPSDFYHSTGYGSGLDNFMYGYNMR